MNMRGKMTGLLLAAVLLFGVAAQAEEQKHYLYTWKDDKGVMHVTDSLEKVPKRFRSRTERNEVEPSGGANVTGAPVPESASEQAAPDESTLKAQWQSRMLDAMRRLQYAEDKYQQLEKRKSELQARWGSARAALPPQEALDQMKQLESELSAARAEVDKARDTVENIIPDEARRAGIPPGWLREVE